MDIRKALNFGWPDNQSSVEETYESLEWFGPGPKPTEQEILDAWDEYQAYSLKKDLLNHAWRLREDRILSGATFDGINIPGDTRTMVFFQALAPLAQANPSFTYPGYRAINGTFDLTADQIVGLYGAGFDLIRDAFLAFNAVEAQIDAGTLTDAEDVQDAYDIAFSNITQE